MARLGTFARAPGPFRLQHDARNNCAAERAWRFELRNAGFQLAAVDHLSPRNCKLGARSLNAALASTLWPSADACQASIGWSNSARARSAVASAWEYLNWIFPASSNSRLSSSTILRNSSFIIE